MNINRIHGANMDIDLCSADCVSWKQEKCPWNQEEHTDTHKCAIKNISLCKYFYGIEYVDSVLCTYPYEKE